MSVVLTQTPATQYVPKYLFISGDSQRGTGKSRHVMKEFLRKRDSIRRQKQLATRLQSRVLPWLRREDMEQVPVRTDVTGVDVGGSSDSPSDFSSRPSSPQQSQWTAGSTMDEAYSSPCFSPPCSLSDPTDLPDIPMKPPYNTQELLDYLHGSVICRLYETEQSSNITSPATVMVNHIMTRSVSARILLAISSLHRDIETGQQTPSSETLSLILEGIGLLKEHLQRPSGVSDDTVLAVLNLWAYEVTLSIGSTRSGPESDSTEGRILPKSLTYNIQTHLNGLQRSINCRGGLRNLSPETLWLLAWCICTLPGYSPIDTRMMVPAVSSPGALQTGTDVYYRPARLFDTLSKIQRHMSLPHSQANILHETSFSPLKTLLRRLNAMRHALNQQPTPINRLRKSASLVSTLLFIFDVFLEGPDSAHREVCDPQDQLIAVQRRLVDHGIDKEGSLEKVWQVLMTQQEAPQLQLHPRTWPIVEMVNVIKHLNISTVDALSQLLLGYLLPETCDNAVEDFRYEKIMLQLHFELDGLADLT
ncbi:uncharacterized protein A1O5_07521 [Cladophialophora psammophila CBS 110553]|uniref:Transcription factor domain-containing protein n=1 Tax=Cladophialophora psammophila CBS 110553 TaxID=1182543 RepID=W9WWQ9_9EURO|nr:uncharacterized protein A1O5_07521 [Cladophialophora psammophila CBS 110553]EXJ69485.1 hypothetical protein A1O5_07521 [Cladophialophora psammophila CBS 110553]